MTRFDILQLVDDEALDAREALDAALQYLSTDDVADLAVTNGWDDYIEDNWDDEDDTYYDPADGYEDTEGFHNSVEEADDEYYDAKIEANTNALSQPTDDDWEDYYSRH